jgi:histone-lysine N-methyltransferase SETMAR
MSGETLSLWKFEYRAVIKYLVKKGKCAKEINEELLATYQQCSPSYATVKRWTRLFKDGRGSIKDDEHPGPSCTVVTEENIKKVEKLVLEDRRIRVRQIAEELKISKDRVGEILHNHLLMSKVSARWVPKMLTPLQRNRRVECSRDFLHLCEDDLDSICHRIVTCDETWIYQYDPESKQESMQWIKKGEKPPRKFKVQRVATKLMATIFWDSAGILLVDYLPRGRTMNGEYYADLIIQLRQAIVEKRRGKLSRGILLLQDNAPVHTAQVAKRAVRDMGFEELNHPPYSPDLAPSDFYLFKDLKKVLRGRRFSGEEEMKSAVNEHFEDKVSEYFFRGIKQLYGRCERCIETDGDYIEK